MKFKDLFIYNKEEKNKYLLNYIFLLSIIVPISLSIYYSYTSDFQPQGRYIMGIIIPFTYFVVNGIEKILEKFVKTEKIKKYIIFMIILLIVFISMIALFGYVIPRYKQKIKKSISDAINVSFEKEAIVEEFIEKKTVSGA